MFNVLLDAKANVFIKDLNGLTAVEHHQQHDLHYRWSTPNKDFIPRLTKAYLEPLCLYFKESSYKQIQNDVGEFLKSLNDEKSFPIKAYHLSAINKLLDLSFDDLDSLYNTFTDDLSYLVYFGTADFEEKVYADILNRINEDDAEIDGQTLKGMKARAKSEDELTSIDNITKSLKKKSAAVSEFLQKSKEVAEKLNKIINKQTQHGNSTVSSDNA